jgi:Rrf2 family protein
MAIGISKKCYYALRAVFELAIECSDEPVTVQEIASVQDVPQRFLEVILNELRRAGIVVSRRGNSGGYLLANGPDNTTVAEVIEAIQGPISVGTGPLGQHAGGAYFCGDAAVERLWEEMNASLAGVCHGRTLTDLVDWEKCSQRAPSPDYAI